LLTTSFLGLRRYLRRRQLQMPAPVTSGWLTFGVILIAALILIGALMPRPSAEYRGVLEWIGLVSPERSASEQAQKRDGAGKGKGKATHEKRGSDGEGGKGQDTSRADGTDGTGADKPGSGGGRDKGKGEGGQDGQGGKGGGESETGDQSAEPSWRSNVLDFLQDLGALTTILKWIIGIVVALVVLFLLMRSGLRFLANFTQWPRRLLGALQRLWASLCGWWRVGESGSDDEEDAPVRPPRPFASFRDPFLSGEVARMTPNELVRYSFEALEAWAVERGIERQAGETPLEFAERVGQETPALELHVHRLAGYYAGLAYARRSLTPDCHASLKQFWRLLVEVIERPLSASV